VVIGRLGQVADGVHERERREPAVGVVLAADPAALVPPAGQLLLEPLLDPVVGKDGELLLFSHRLPPVDPLRR
jgi:hypothetical protein